MLLKNRVVWHLKKTEWFDGEIHHILCLWLPVRKSTSQTFLRDCLSENLLLKTLKVLHNWNSEYCTTELWHFFRLPKLWLLHCYFGIDTTMKPPVDVLSKVWLSTLFSSCNSIIAGMIFKGSHCTENIYIFPHYLRSPKVWKPQR